jgi:hypothetical protein
VNVTSPAGCSWTASTNTSWIDVQGSGNGTRNGSVQLSIEANGGAARTGTATIAGHTFTINQGSGCSFAINPASHTVPSASSSVSVDVTAAGSCAWTAASNAAWLTVTDGASGSGPGTVKIEVQANPGAERSGTVTIAGHSLTVVQQSGCSFAVAPDTIPAPAAGLARRVDVTTAGSCEWTATSGAGWIGAAPGGGTGNGGVDLTIAANTGPARTGIVTIAGRAVTVNQESGCVYGLSATAVPMPAGSGSGFVNVTAGAGCPWTAASNAAWITVTGGASGTGDGAVQFAVEANATGAPRNGTMTIAGLTFTVNQQ